MAHYYNRQKVLFLFIVLMAIVTTGALFAQSSNEGFQERLGKGISKLDHKTGLEDAERYFDKERYREHFRGQATIQGSRFRKNATAEETKAVTDQILEVINKVHGLPNNSFKFTSKYVDEVGHLHVSTEQYYKGIRVEGRVIFSFDSSGILYDITGKFAQGLNISIVPRLTSDDAVKAAKTAVDVESKSEDKPELMIIDAKLVYKLKLSEQGLPGWWNFVVDAQTGEVLEKQTSVAFLNPPASYPNSGLYNPSLGLVVVNEERSSNYAELFNAWYNNSNSYGYLFNNNEHWQVGDVATNAVVQNTTSGTLWSQQRPFVTLARNMELVQAFVRDSFSLNSFDGKGAMATLWYPVVFSGDPNPTCNAKWTGSEFQFGSGGCGVMYERVVLSSVAHEFGHAITQYHAGMPGNTNNEPGALSEAYSDILATCVEAATQPDGRDQYSSASKSMQRYFDWLHGEDGVHHTDNTRWWIRNLREPLVGGTEGNHPTLYGGTAWRTDGELHYNSTVPSHAFYLIAEGANVESTHDPAYNHRDGPFRGLGINVARKIAWDGQWNGTLLSYANFASCRNTWIKSCYNVTGGDAGIVAQAWAAVGVIEKTVGKPSGTTTLPCNPPNYSTISAAIAAAAPGEIIYVYPGSYTENITITNYSQSLVSRNRDLTTITGTITLNSTADGTTITGFTINPGSGKNCITLNGTSSDNIQNVTMGQCRFQNCANGIVVNYGNHVNAIGNQFTTCQSTSIAQNNSTACGFFDNKISGGAGVSINTNSNKDNFFRNRFESVSTDAVYTASGTNNNYIGWNEFMNISGREFTSYGSIYLIENIFSNQNGFDFLLASSNTVIMQRKNGHKVKHIYS
jgi:Zn-dependent metalloprotease